MKETKMKDVFIALGSNIGDRRTNLKTARYLIDKKIGKITVSSNIYETEPWGHSDQPDFLNQVVKIKSDLAAPAILKSLLSIEEKMGRVRTFKNAPRTIDLDILFYGNEIIDTTDVTIPHIFLAKRKFVLAPLAEIAPNLIHPVILKSVAQMLNECTDPLKVYKLGQTIHSELSV